VKHIVIYKLVLLNALAIAWLAITDYQTGWLNTLFHADTTRLNYGTAGLFVLVWIGTMRKAWEINRAANNLNGSHIHDEKLIGSLRLKQMEWIERAAGWMLFLGLIGTLYGLMLSLSGVNTGNFGSVEGIKHIAVQMVAGLRVEISTTIIGAMFALWTEVNFVVVKHTADVVAQAEDELLEEAKLENVMRGDIP
jgi:hypothetical protein